MMLIWICVFLTLSTLTNAAEWKQRNVNSNAFQPEKGEDEMAELACLTCSEMCPWKCQMEERYPSMKLFMNPKRAMMRLGKRAVMRLG